MKHVRARKPLGNQVRILRWILERLAIRSEKDQIGRDYQEDYNLVARESGRRRAFVWGILQIVISVFPFLRARALGTLTMTHLHLKTAVRGLRRRAGFSFINISGLALGMAACLLLVRYISYECSYDRFHEKGARIYRLKKTDWAGSHGPAGRTARDTFPEVLEYVKINPIFANGVFARGDRSFKEDRVYFATSSLLEVFSFDLLQGDPGTALEDADRVVLTESVSEKYFGSENPMGQALTFAGQREYTVTGILRDIPHNSHMNFDILVSMPTLRGEWAETSWYWTSMHTYLLLRPGTDPKAFEDKLKLHFGQLEKQLDQNEHSGLEYELQPLGAIHLTSHHEFELEENGDITTIYFLGFITIMILLSAWINYTNLCTARSAERAREIGLRKVIGACRRDVLAQFFGESLLYNTLAIAAAFVLVRISSPFFHLLTGIPGSISIWNTAVFWLAVLFFLLFGSLISGLYPALVLASFKPANVLQGRLTNKFGRTLLRKGLVVFQFAVSVILIAGTVTIFYQISYMKGQDLGMDIDRTLVVKAPQVYANRAVDERLNKVQVFKAETGKRAGIRRSALSSFVPGEYVLNIHGIRPETSSKNEARQTHILSIDHDYLEFFGIELLAGRSFSQNFQADRDKAILNRASAKSLGFEDPEAAVGRKVYMEDDLFEIIGVAADHHQQSLKHDFAPIFMMNRAMAGGNISLKIASSSLPETLAAVRSVWDDVFPGNPFDYFFLDEHFNRQYAADLKFGQVSGIFTILAVMIGCLGLFGLSSLDVARRIKEIGIRKTLGATFRQISGLMLRDIFKLIALAVLIALPVSYFLFRQWLIQYAFRIDIGWWFAGIPALLIFVIAYLTVFLQVMKASRANPVDALRYE